MPRVSKKELQEKQNISLTFGMKFDSPWLGKGTIVKFHSDPQFGTMVHVLWDFMNNVTTHLESAIVHEVWLEKKNVERLAKLN
jgi:hypothetical protein